jgi:hypothetical protein
VARKTLLTDAELAVRWQRFLEAAKLQEIEGNPLTAEDFAMFQMFHRERWPDPRCRANIMAQARKLAKESRSKGCGATA